MSSLECCTKSSLNLSLWCRHVEDFRYFEIIAKKISVLIRKITQTAIFYKTRYNIAQCMCKNSEPFKDIHITASAKSSLPYHIASNPITFHFSVVTLISIEIQDIRAITHKPLALRLASVSKKILANHFTCDKRHPCQEKHKNPSFP